jgi:hypothetical protein
MAGNLPLRGIVFCNLGTSKTVISTFVTTQQILLPHIFPHMVTPTMFPVDKKTQGRKKRLGHKCINSFLTCYLTIAGYVFFFNFGRLRVPTRLCDLVVPADWGWGRGNKYLLVGKHRASRSGIL